EIAKRTRLPGFRKGKAPVAVVRRKYADAIREQVLREVITESWKATLDQEQIEPIADPHVHDLKFETGNPLTFELHVELKPEIALERVGGFTLARTVRPVADAMVAEQLEELRRQRGAWVPLADERPKPGDMVTVTLTTLTEGETAEPKDYPLVIGQGQAIPDIEEQIMQRLPGETAEADVRFPDDFPDETKRGTTRRIRLALREAKRQQLAELDDGFAREVGDFDSLDALKQAVRDDLEAEARREADADVRRQVMEQIVTANDVPAPRGLADRLISAYAKAYSVPDDKLEGFAAEFRTLAEAQVRRDLVMDHVARTQELRATEAEIDDRVAELAKRRNAKPGEVYSQLQKAGQIKELEQRITEDKVWDYLLSQSTVTES
ncbi:MAG: trigger factor, partial [Gemmatimonadota bacterium]|nr:trigger factor [Gemmatimonadota bacterium]